MIAETLCLPESTVKGYVAALLDKLGATSRLHAAIQAARQALLAMRSKDEIGDDAFHRMEEQLDWLEMADSSRTPEPSP